MARHWRRLWVAAAALLAATALGAWWLLGSGGGRDLLLQQVIGTLPEGTLRIGGREGSLAGGVRFRDLRYEDDRVRVEIAILEARPRVPSPAGPALALSALRLRGIRVWPKEAPVAPLPPWPASLPSLDLPFGVHIDQLDVRDLVVQPAGDAAAPFTVDRFAAVLAMASGRLAAEDLLLEVPQGRVRGEVRYAPSRDFASSAVLDAELASGARVALRLEGGLGGGRATLEGEAGGPLAVAFEWQDAARLDRLAWQLHVDATQFEPGVLGFPSQPPVDVSLRARGGPDAAAAEATVAPGLHIVLGGRVARDGIAVVLDESRLRWHDGVLHAQPLSASLFGGRVGVTGRYAVDGGGFDVVARLEALSWGEGDNRVQADGDAALVGRIDDWAADLDLGLARGGQRATLDARARGDAGAVVLAPFTLATPGGSLEGEARFAFDASAAFSVEATMHGLDPAWLAPGWPGRIDARLRVDGAAPDAAPMHYVVELAEASGTLRGERLEGDARLEAHGEALRVRSALTLGEGRVAAEGALRPELGLDVALRTVDLAPWQDGLRGMLDGRLKVAGTTERPAFDMDVVLLDGGWQDLAVQRLTARGALPARGEGGIDVRAEALSQGPSRIEAIELRADGRVDDGRFRLAIRGIDAPELPTDRAGVRGRLEATGTWRIGDGFAEGAVLLEDLDARLPALPRVSLAGPSTVAWRGSDWSLPAAACLAIGDEGRLCAEGSADDARAVGTALDLAWLAPFLPSDAGTPLVPSGRVALEATRRRVDGTTIAAVRVEAPRGRLHAGGVSSEAVFGWNDLVLEAARHEGWRVDLQADLVPDGRLQARLAADAEGALSGELALRVADLGLLEVLSADFAAPRGTVDGRLLLSGTVDDPRWQGALAIAPFAVELPALGIAVDDGELHVDDGEDGQLRLHGRLPTGDGALAISGQWSEDGRPNRLAIRGTDVRVLDTPDGRAWISPVLDLELADGVAMLRGRVDVPRAEFALDRFEQGVATSPDVVVIDDPVTADASPGLALDAEFTLAFGEDVRLRGFGFDGRLDGELAIRDRVDRAPRARGTLELAGAIRAYGQQLDLERGTLRWANVAIDEPSIDVRAVRPDSDPEVGVAVTGTGVSPVVDVWSRPPLPQAEALSWLMFGRPLAAADGNDAAQLQQAATSLGGSVVAQAVAGKIGLDTASVGESRALGGTALTVGKRITPKLYVSYGMSLSGTGQVVTVTYALRRWLAAQVETGIEHRIELEAKFERD